MQIVYDQFFTPTAIADYMVQHVNLESVASVGDFAAGAGDLLRAASLKWPSAKIVACDIDPKCVSRMRRLFTGWSVSCCDFLNAKSRQSARAIPAQPETLEVLLMNPPFSGRGNSSEEAFFIGQILRCSRAMAFIATGLQHLRPNGVGVAILPASSLRSRKDMAAREAIGKHYDFEVLKTCGRRTFGMCSAESAVVRFKRRETCLESRRSNEHRIPGCEKRLYVKIVRGKLPVYRSVRLRSTAGYPFIHTRDILSDGIVTTGDSVVTSKSPVDGPAVLVSRVGSPTSEKIGLLAEGTSVVLSDCVIAITCRTSRDALMVYSRLRKSWSAFSDMYKGTGAPYITLSLLTNFLYSCSIESESQSSNIASDTMMWC